MWLGNGVPHRGNSEFQRSNAYEFFQDLSGGSAGIRRRRLRDVHPLVFHALHGDRNRRGGRVEGAHRKEQRARGRFRRDDRRRTFVGSAGRVRFRHVADRKAAAPAAGAAGVGGGGRGSAHRGRLSADERRRRGRRGCAARGAARGAGRFQAERQVRRRLQRSLYPGRLLPRVGGRRGLHAA